MTPREFAVLEKSIQRLNTRVSMLTGAVLLLTVFVAGLYGVRLL